VKRDAAMCVVALAAGSLAAQGAPPAGPSGRCDLVVVPRSDSTRVNSIKQPSGQYNSFVGGGVTGSCPAQQLTLTSDSAEYFGDLKRWHLIGNVHYKEPRLTLDSQVATYFMTDERVLAEGDVHTLLPSGTTLVGPRVDYYRAVPGVRAVGHMVAPGRPTITLVEHDSTGKPSPPMTLIANTTVMDEDSLVWASGHVEMTREEVTATSDSAALDGGHEFGRLMRKPVIHSRSGRPFTLYGTIIDLYGSQKQLKRVLARGAGKAVSDDATVTADTLDFEFTEGVMTRMHGWGASRSHAVNPTYDILSDSLDMRSPGQRLREIRSVRKAFAQSIPDSTKVRTKKKDWMRGDTIIARFDSTPAITKADSGRQPQMLQLIALGNASSYYQFASKDTTAIGPVINYVRGSSVDVAFLDRQVQTVTVKDSVAGVYVEPVPKVKPKKTDTTATPKKTPAKKTTP